MTTYLATIGNHDHLGALLAIVVPLGALFIGTIMAALATAAVEDEEATYARIRAACEAQDPPPVNLTADAVIASAAEVYAAEFERGEGS